MKIKLAVKSFEIIIFLQSTFESQTRGFNFETSLNPSTYDRLRLKVDQEGDQHHKNEGCLQRFLNCLTYEIFVCKS